MDGGKLSVQLRPSLTISALDIDPGVGCFSGVNSGTLSEPFRAQTRVQWKRWLPRIALVLLAAVVIAGVWLRVWYRKTYPFGSSHCCAGVLGMELRIFAKDNKGLFPAGESTPEASLGLLAKDHDAVLGILRGKTIPLSHTKAAYLQEGKLGPSSCGWFYIEGLKDSDDRRLALAWDKYGLGHNGQKLEDGGHEVLFMDGSHRTFSGIQWDEFLAEQRKLFQELKPELIGVLDAWATNYALRDSRAEALRQAR